MSAPVADLYQEVQQFYADQMRLLDDGAVAEWAQTFTEDGVFAANAHPEPIRGRVAIEAGARAAAEELARTGVRRRHWLGMVSVRPGTDDSSLAVDSYALVIATPRDGKPTLHASTSCVDDLVRDGDGWLVRHRRVTRDDLA
jgi:3-phenylpropionate/cinnamic acid dioxygenase small subunit